MSFIGSLDQFDLSIILQRIESYKKSGLLVVKQGDRSVELSFRQGQLMCIGPVRPDISLADRLFQAGIISWDAYQEVVQALGAERFREVGTALALIDLGHVNQQSLYRWAFDEATRVIEALIAWTDGDIYFEENQQPSNERLLIALSISSILPEPEQPSEVPAPSASTDSSPSAVPAVAQRPPVSGATSATRNSIANEPTMHGEEPILLDDVTTITAYQPSLFTPPANAMQDTERFTDALAKPAPGTLLPPRPVMTPPAPAQVNTAYIQPQMVLTPVDLSAYREQNPQITLTPDQWRLFTRADGQTTLQVAIQELGMSPGQVRQVAGELVALGIATLSLTGYRYGDANELSPVARDYVQPGLSNDMMMPGYSPIPAQSSLAPSARFSLPYPIETQSQWGNGGNGATFVLGNGWVVTPPDGQPSQPMPLRYQEESQVYAKAG